LFVIVLIMVFLLFLSRFVNWCGAKWFSLITLVFIVLVSQGGGRSEAPLISRFENFGTLLDALEGLLVPPFCLVNLCEIGLIGLNCWVLFCLDTISAPSLWIRVNILKFFQTYRVSYSSTWVLFRCALTPWGLSEFFH